MRCPSCKNITAQIKRVIESERASGDPSVREMLKYIADFGVAGMVGLLGFTLFGVGIIVAYANGPVDNKSPIYTEHSNVYVISDVGFLFIVCGIAMMTFVTLRYFGLYILYRIFMTNLGLYIGIPIILLYFAYIGYHTVYKLLEGVKPPSTQSDISEDDATDG